MARGSAADAGPALSAVAAAALLSGAPPRSPLPGLGVPGVRSAAGGPAVGGNRRLSPRSGGLERGRRGEPRGPGTTPPVEIAGARRRTEFPSPQSLFGAGDEWPLRPPSPGRSRRGGWGRGRAAAAPGVGAARGNFPTARPAKFPSPLTELV